MGDILMGTLHALCFVAKRLQHLVALQTDSSSQEMVGVEAVLASCKLVLPGELAKHAVSEANKALLKVGSYKGEDAIRQEIIDIWTAHDQFEKIKTLDETIKKHGLEKTLAEVRKKWTGEQAAKTEDTILDATMEEELARMPVWEYYKATGLSVAFKPGTKESIRNQVYTGSCQIEPIS